MAKEELRRVSYPTAEDDSRIGVCQAMIGLERRSEADLDGASEA